MYSHGPRLAFDALSPSGHPIGYLVETLVRQPWLLAFEPRGSQFLFVVRVCSTRGKLSFADGVYEVSVWHRGRRTHAEHSCLLFVGEAAHSMTGYLTATAFVLMAVDDFAMGTV